MLARFKYFKNQNATLILAPFSGGQGKRGVEQGPNVLIGAGLQEQIEKLNWKTSISEPLKSTNFEELKETDEPHGNCKRPKVVGDATKLIYEAVKEVSLKGHLPITVGGDHSIAIGTVSGSFAKHPNAGLIWVDAHADINTPATTPSGNLHGCPVAFLMGLDSHDSPPDLKWVPPVLKPNKIAYIGLRDVDAGERKILKEHGIAAFSMYHVDRYGINKVVEMAIEAVSGGDKGTPIHLGYDVDSIDPRYFPATGAPVPGGLTLREGLFVAERIAETGNLIALDVVEFNPSLSDNEVCGMDSTAIGCAIVTCALGGSIL